MSGKMKMDSQECRDEFLLLPPCNGCRRGDGNQNKLKIDARVRVCLYHCACVREN